MDCLINHAPLTKRTWVLCHLLGAVCHNHWPCDATAGQTLLQACKRRTAAIMHPQAEASGCQVVGHVLAHGSQSNEANCQTVCEACCRSGRQGMQQSM